MELTKKQELINIHSDFFKSVNGIRPRWYNYDAFTCEELEAEIDSLAEESARQVEEERIWIEAQAVKLEKKISDLIEMGAGTRQKALVWLVDSYGEYSWIDDVLYDYGVTGTPYRYELEKEIEAALLAKNDDGSDDDFIESFNQNYFEYVF